ncbi:tyrosine-type recombinase/integrase [Actinomadura sp. LD22]|uniref:Tyrosine-type recombinase/integrase n=1 Tax=Actinomadura physcomitrii TaxID=2650748 RepID=A0A6I4ME29_9ACTN|nr:site-specific integrase [Actinomadura physcomitrii]MWA02308.1 tyrosine-type recombinase/integrase [Actinomadura physcomitrii]MWA03120.1 tyrosine-type recombinase/integrase [Actinomadura physcomitrii]
MSKILIGKYAGTIYQEKGGYTGAVALGFGPDGKRKRLKRKGRTKSQVLDRLKEAVADLEAGVKTPVNYTVGDAVEDWLAKGLRGLDDDTVINYRSLARKHVIPLIGKPRLGDLKADDVDTWLDGLTDSLSTRTLRLVHAILKRAIRQAQARDMVTRNVAELVKTPKGLAGRPSRALTLEQAQAVLAAAKSSRLHAYVELSLLTGVRTEEARALRWDHVVAWVDEEEWRPVVKAGFDHERFAIYVWRSVRAGGDTKTEKSRRTLELPGRAAEALRRHHTRQAAQRLKAGEVWQDNGLVFCSTSGRPLDAANVRRALRLITKKAGIGETWSPRELRHSFVSIMSDGGLPIEAIADLCGHSSPAVTGEVYRHQLRPVITKGAEAVDAVFGPSKSA